MNIEDFWGRSETIPDRDSLPDEEATFTDLHPESLAQYRSQLRAVRGDHPFLAVHDEEFAEIIGAAKLVDNIWRPTFAGLLMLGKELSIRTLLPHWHLSFKEITTGSTRWDDRFASDGTWNANLFQFHKELQTRITRHIKTPFATVDGWTRTDETDVHIAVREAFINQLIHADYRSPTGIQITRRGNEIEFANPGVLLVSEKQLWAGGISRCRNAALQRMFNILNLGEHEGSGGPTIRSTWTRQQWKRPTLIQDFEHDRTRLILSQESLVSDQIVASVETPIATIELNKRASAKEVETAILKICEADFRTLEEIAEALNRSTYTVRAKYLPPLIEAGSLLRRFDSSNHPNQAYKSAEVVA